MKGFTQIEGVAASLPWDNIDTDMLCPAQFLHTISKAELGKCLFYEFRHNADGSLAPDFVLNRPAYRNAKILIAGKNFGSGSSREHAAWAVKDFGIRCVIARDFADIFYINALKNGILCVSLSQKELDVLMRDAEQGANAVFTVDLASQKIIRPDGQAVEFEIDPFRKDYLLQGRADVDEFAKMRTAINSFEAKHRASQPWLWG